MWKIIALAVALQFVNVLALEVSECDSSVAGSIYDYRASTLDGGLGELLSKYSGKISIVMNTATFDDRCSIDMPGMNALLQTYETVEVVGFGFPCGQFALLEPVGRNYEIMNEFMHVRPGNGWTPHANFHIYSKIEVNGAGASNVYKQIRAGCTAFKDEIGAKEEIEWQAIESRDITDNFEKVLVDASGKPRFRFGSSVSFPEIYPYIDQLLQETPIQPPIDQGFGRDV